MTPRQARAWHSRTVDGRYAHGERGRPQHRFLGRGGDDAHHPCLAASLLPRSRSRSCSPTLGLGTCLTSWASHGGEPLLRQAVGVPDDWMLAGRVVIGWPRGHHGPVPRRPLHEVVSLDVFDGPADSIVKSRPDPPVP